MVFQSMPKESRLLESVALLEAGSMSKPSLTLPLDAAASTKLPLMSHNVLRLCCAADRARRASRWAQAVSVRAACCATSKRSLGRAGESDLSRLRVVGLWTYEAGPCPPPNAHRGVAPNFQCLGRAPAPR